MRSLRQAVSSEFFDKFLRAFQHSLYYIKAFAIFTKTLTADIENSYSSMLLKSTLELLLLLLRWSITIEVSANTLRCSIY